MPLSRKLIRIFMIFFIMLFWAGVAQAEKLIFVPGNRTPISKFVTATSSSTSFSVRIDVLKDIKIRWGKAVLIAEKIGEGEVKYLEPTRVDMNTGMVFAATTAGGKYVVVSDAYLNSLPISTNWNQSANFGRGKPEIGASDGINSYSLNDDGSIKSEINLISKSSDDDLYYNIVEYDLFYTGPDDRAYDVPGYERYVGENYSTTKISDEYALNKTNEVTSYADSGYPVILFNYHDCEYKLWENVPAFQVINNVLIEATKGNASLATVVLPPFFSFKSPDASYPVIIETYYDINRLVYVEPKRLINMCRVIAGDSYNGQGSAIGIFWNGGGAWAHAAAHGSFYDNIALLFEMAEDILHADVNNIISFGWSRGGLAALAMSGNPYHDNYKIKYAIASNSPAKLGYTMETSYLTAPALARYSEFVSGYKKPYLEDWTAPDGKTGFELGFSVFALGDEAPFDAERVDAKSVGSDMILDKIKDNGTKILVGNGTHDVYKTMDQQMEFFENAKAKGIPIDQKIVFRAGHAPPFRNYSYDIVKAMASSIIENTDFDLYNFDGTNYYFKRSNLDIDLFSDLYGSFEEFFPTHFPLIIEAPGKLVKGACPAPVVVTGEPGTEYRISMANIDFDSWHRFHSISYSGAMQLVASGELPEPQGNAISSSVRFDVEGPTTDPSGYYLVQVEYKIPGASDFTILPWSQGAQYFKHCERYTVGRGWFKKTYTTCNDIVTKGRAPVLRIFDTESSVYFNYDVPLVGFGMSEY